MKNMVLRLTAILFSMPLCPVVCSRSGTCVSFKNEIVKDAFPRLDLAMYPEFALESNSYGVHGRVSSLTECVSQNTGENIFGWNWTRGHTNPPCIASCKAPTCFYDFSFMALAHGVSPWGGSTGANDMPQNLDTLQHLTITQNVEWTWEDTAPGKDPPETSPNNIRRVRFIYDFFLTHAKPNGSNIEHTITDEVTINLASNPDFPGSQPPGCFDRSRFSNKTWGPVLEDAVWDGYHWYDYYWTDHHDAVPAGMRSRYSSFRRKGADEKTSVIPSQVDVRPFIDAIRRMWPNEKVGPWLGHISIGTEVYDHVNGHVVFRGPPTLKPVPAQQTPLV